MKKSCCGVYGLLGRCTRSFAEASRRSENASEATLSPSTSHTFSLSVNFPSTCNKKVHITFCQSHIKRSSDTSFFVHFWTHFCQIGGVLISHIHFLSPIIQNVLYILCAKVVLNDTYNPKYMNYEIKLFRIFIFRRSPKLKSSKLSQNQAQLLQK